MTALIAHRGYSAKHPENTMEAFRAAYDSGFRNIELDVHISGGGVPVVAHNHRLFNGRPVTEESVLPNTIPHLEEVAKWAARHGVTLFVDIKRESVAAFGAKTVAILVKNTCKCHFVPVSFDLEVLQCFRGRTLYANDAVGDVVSIESVNGPLDAGTAVYTARTPNEVRLLAALGAEWVMVDDCGLAEGLPGEWLV